MTARDTAPSAALAGITVDPREVHDAISLELGSLRLQLIQEQAVRGKLEAKVRELEAQGLADGPPADPHRPTAA